MATAGATLAFAAIAPASSFQTGTYVAGNTTTGAGVKMQVKRHSFSVNVIRFREKSDYGTKSFSEYFKFVSGSEAKLTGEVASDGRFSGKYTSNAGYVSVHGRVQGNTATVTGSEAGPYNPASTVRPNHCSGSHTFNAHKVVVSTRR